MAKNNLYQVHEVAEALRDQELFEAAYNDSIGGKEISKIAGEKITYAPYIDMSLYLTSGRAVEVTGNEVEHTRNNLYTNKWTLDRYDATIERTVKELKHGEVREAQVEAWVGNAASWHIRAATDRLATMLDTGSTGVPSKVEDKSTSVNLFSTSHSLSGTTYSNYRSTNPITSSTTNPKDVVDYFESVLALWEDNPDDSGREAGMGNVAESNLLVIASTNIRKQMRWLFTQPQLQDTSTNNLLQNPYGNMNIPYVLLSGLSNDTVILTRRPEDAIPGFVYARNPEVESYYDEPDTRYDAHRWSVRMDWTVAPTAWMASYLLKQAS